ncbi:hypothetical protein [Bradyrhizobium yuanmingense]|uniref:hypothetical protein n=1 Tax=Bradyrhizobium yuanmingense TaxID=108015 RepID=UPI003513B204
MAKKQKKTAKKTSNAKVAKAPAPRYMQGKKPKAIAFHKVADVLAVIEKHGHGRKFKRQSKASEHSVILHPETVNFIKDFLAENNMHTDPIGRKAITSGGDYDCD